jgi:flagellar FliJ protein
MNRQRPTQLALVRGLAETREQELAGQVSELMRERASAEATLARLGGYLDEYAAGASRDDAPARTLGEIDNERRFVKQLNDAVCQQRGHAQRLVERTSLAMSRWHRARTDLEALDRVIARREGEQRRAAARQEQRETDAHNSRHAHRRVTLPETHS